MFLADGQPEGLRIVEKSNWNGVALMCARAQFPDVRARREFDRAGAYVLVGHDENDPARMKLYVGEGDPTRPRLDAHARQKDFWTHLMAFTSKDGALNKAHVQYLESRLVELASAAKRAALENGNVPQRPNLAEADQADAESFLDDMLLIFPLLGVTAFEVADAREKSGPSLVFEVKGVRAQGKDTAEGFVVFKGSGVVKETVPSIQQFLRSRREELISQGVIVAANGGYRFAQDFVFESPSTAAGVVAGRSVNGRVEWKSSDGRTLKELQEQAVADG